MRHAGFQHQALIYEGPEDYLEGTVPFLRGALEAGEPAMVAVGRRRRQAIEEELGEEADRIFFADMEKLGRNPAWIIPFWREFVDEAGGHSVRGIGEPVWAARTPAALEECRRHESLLNVAFAPRDSWSLLCPYDAGSLGDEILDKVACSHPHIHRDGRREQSFGFEAQLDAFAGELPPPASRPEQLVFGLTELGEVRHRVAAAAEAAGMDTLAVADLVTATSELAANSVMHGGGTGTLRLWHEGGRLLAEVEDRGRIEDPLVGRLRPDISQEGGRGLWLANRLCDLVQIRSGERGTTVRLHLLDREAAYV